MADQGMVSAAIAESKGLSEVFHFKMRGYSRGKQRFKNGECTVYPPFSFGGYNWVLRYYPNISFSSQDKYIRVVLDSPDAKDVKVKAKFSVLDKDGLRVEQHSGFIQEKIFPSEGGGFGLISNQAGLEQSGHIVDDCLSIRIDLTLIKDIRGEEMMGNQFVVVPPSDLHRHFANLLESMDGADVAFHVGGMKFLAHRSVFAARSSLFKAELLGAMKEKTGCPIEIHEMEADVFKCLLHFLYTTHFLFLRWLVTNLKHVEMWRWLAICSWQQTGTTSKG